MTKHPHYHHSLDDLFLHVYRVVDDWLKANETRFDLPKQPKQVASYSELFTIAVVGELVAQPYKSVWYWLVGQSYQELFPKLPEYSRYYRVVRNAEKLWAELAVELVRDSLAAFKIVDAKPLPVAKGKRAQWAKCLGASKGFSTMGMVYGFKLHALTNEQGLFEKWAFAPAHESDVTLAHELLEGCKDTLVLGDKAYISASVCTPKRKNMTQEDGWQA